MGSEEEVNIPDVLHFIWVGSKPPEWVNFIVTLWRNMNPDFEIMFHKSGGPLVLDKYEDFYSNMKMTCNKVDVQKWGLLQQHGGWVMDTDTVPLRPFREYLDTLETDKDFVGVEYSKNRGSLDMGWIGATTDSAVWPVMDEFLVDLKGANFKRPNQGGHGAINYAYKKRPDLFHVDKREIYCPYSRHDYNMRRFGLEFFDILQHGGNVMPYISRYYEEYNFPAFGWHLWANGRNVLNG